MEKSGSHYCSGEVPLCITWTVSRSGNSSRS